MPVWQVDHIIIDPAASLKCASLATAILVETCHTNRYGRDSEYLQIWFSRSGYAANSRIKDWALGKERRRNVGFGTCHRFRRQLTGYASRIAKHM